MTNPTTQTTPTPWSIKENGSDLHIVGADGTIVARMTRGWDGKTPNGRRRGRAFRQGLQGEFYQTSSTTNDTWGEI